MRSLVPVWSGVAVISCLLASTVADADENPGLVISKADISKVSPEKIIAGTSVVLILDASYSVDPEENAQMVEGIKEALLDEEKIVYKDCLAISAVHYADTAQSSLTYIVCSKQGMEEFITKEIDYIPGVKPQAQYGVGAYTNISSGLYRARDIVTKEKELGIYALKHSFVLIGDGHAQKGTYDLLPEIVSLAKEFGVTSYAIPIEDHQKMYTNSARSYYLQQLVTPAGLTYKNEVVFGKYEQPVPPGQYLPANDFSDVRHAVTLALTGAGL